MLLQTMHKFCTLFPQLCVMSLGYKKQKHAKLTLTSKSDYAARYSVRISFRGQTSTVHSGISNWLYFEKTFCISTSCNCKNVHLCHSYNPGSMSDVLYQNVTISVTAMLVKFLTVFGPFTSMYLTNSATNYELIRLFVVCIIMRKIINHAVNYARA